jgi:hypothetical protein
MMSQLPSVAASQVIRVLFACMGANSYWPESIVDRFEAGAPPSPPIL